MRHTICSVAELPPGSRKIIEIAGRSIGVFNIGGEFFALRNRCPHQGGPLCEGHLTGFVTSTAPGVYDYSRTDEILRCPWHGWEFDIRTGQSWFDPAKVRVRRYEVAVAYPAPDAPPTPDAPATNAPVPGLKAGPYLAETYAVSVEAAYVVVEVPA